MKSDTGKFSFKVPEGHPEQGKKIEKTFEYDVVENDSEAQTVLTERKGLTLTGLVNEYLKSNARSNAYQSARMPYAESNVSEETIVERMVRDFIRIGVNEETARKQVAALRAAASGQ